MKSRRKLLLTLSATTAATIWNKPVVKTIILPAHAQTSCAALTIPDAISDCSDHDDPIRYYIDDDGLCPMIIEGQTPQGSSAEAFIIRSFLSSGTAVIDLDPSQPGGTTLSVVCGTGALGGGSESPGSVPAFNVLSTSGIDYTFSGTYNNLGAGNGASVTGMSFVPAT